jgi:hypothetical protein
VALPCFLRIGWKRCGSPPFSGAWFEACLVRKAGDGTIGESSGESRFLSEIDYHCAAARKVGWLDRVAFHFPFQNSNARCFIERAPSEFLSNAAEGKYGLGSSFQSDPNAWRFMPLARIRHTTVGIESRFRIKDICD